MFFLCPHHTLQLNTLQHVIRIPQSVPTVSQSNPYILQSSPMSNGPNHVYSQTPSVNAQTHTLEPSNASSDIAPLSSTSSYTPNNLVNSHSMITRAKSGISKPKTFNVESSIVNLEEPLTAGATLSTPRVEDSYECRSGCSDEK